jgi:hypothetical protein
MSVIDATYRTMTCNGVGCTNSVTFDIKNAEETFKATPWLRTFRIVQANGRNFFYCGDLCEISGIEAEVHNPPEEKKIVELPSVGSATSAIQAAAAAARAAEESTRKIKSGEGGQIQISQ